MARRQYTPSLGAPPPPPQQQAQLTRARGSKPHLGMGMVQVACASGGASNFLMKTGSIPVLILAMAMTRQSTVAPGIRSTIMVEKGKGRREARRKSSSMLDGASLHCTARRNATQGRRARARPTAIWASSGKRGSRLNSSIYASLRYRSGRCRVAIPAWSGNGRSSDRSSRPWLLGARRGRVGEAGEVLLTELLLGRGSCRMLWQRRGTKSHLVLTSCWP